MQVHSDNRIKTFVELKEYIYATLCQNEQLAVGAFPITWQVLKRGNQTCGFLFSVQGPRNVMFNAVFAVEHNVVHFYNSAGQRVLTKQVGVASSLLGSWRTAHA